MLKIALITILAVSSYLTSFTTNSFYYEADRAQYERILMPITNYSELDSCHYPVKGGCLTASGVIASEHTAACPRSWKKGLKILVEGKEYVCEDYYQLGLSDRIDLWAGYGKESHEQALEFGRKRLNVIVIK